MSTMVKDNKKKLIAGAVAGVAALALIGGGTFALWSDFEIIDGGTAQAGQLDLIVNGGPSNFPATPIAPGERYGYTYVLGSADLDGVPSGVLTANLANLVDKENGCSGGELQADADCDTVDDGEFSDQSTVRIRWTNPINNAAVSSCNWNTNPGIYVNSNGVGDLNDGPSLSSAIGQTLALGTVTSGQGVCVRVDVGLPPEATNASQGDSASFDVRFDLTQSPVSRP